MNEPNRIKLFIAIGTTTVTAFMETFRYVIKTVCHLQRDRKKCLQILLKDSMSVIILIHSNQPLTSRVLVGFFRHPVNKRLSLS